MQVFIVGSPLETAMALDPKRLRKQIIECGQIFDALKGNRAWSNHPCVLQYREYMQWLYEYMQCLMEYNRGRKNTPLMYSNFANEITPPDWHTQEYYDQMKRRLYTKDPEYYKQWAHLGESDCDWYFVDGSWRKYVNGKRVE